MNRLPLFFIRIKKEPRMSEKRMLIVDAEVVRKIDENRGDMSCSEFINFLIDNQLEGHLGEDGQRAGIRNQGRILPVPAGNEGTVA